MGRLFTFIGVTTASSSIMRIFPRWRDTLGLGADIQIIGWDLPIGAPASRYCDTVQALAADPTNLGGLVTTHKIDLYRAAGDLFDELDHYARLCGEVSCIARRDGRLCGWAKDPVSAGKTLEGLLGNGYFARTGGDALVFGAGGAGVAILLHLLSRPDPGDRPRRIVVTDPSAERLESLCGLRERLGSTVDIEYVRGADAVVNDALLAGLRAGSLVVNATGMGKDRPGSPVSGAAPFPRDGIAWELNYRGELTFLRQARRQAAARGVRAEDGWRYFIFGWTAVIEEVFGRRITPAELDDLARLATFARPPVPAEET